MLQKSSSYSSKPFSREAEEALYAEVEGTCPSLGFFQPESDGRIRLTNILKAWMAFDAAEAKANNIPAVGYGQGMNFVAAILLWHAGDEEAAFWVFVAMMKHYGLRCMFAPPDLPGLKMRSFTVVHLLYETMPDLCEHLTEHLEGQNNISLVLTEWLLTIFSSSLPLGALAQLWDRFFHEGYSVVYRLILARLRCLKPWLLAETDMEKLGRIIKYSHVDFDRSHRPRALTGGDPDSELIAKLCPWTCMACNGSESCNSWELLVTVMLTSEKVSMTTIMELEKMFVPAPETISLCDDEEHNEAGAVAMQNEVSPQKAQISAQQELEADNERLVLENDRLRGALSRAQHDTADAQRELAEAQKEIMLLRAQHKLDQTQLLIGSLQLQIVDSIPQKSDSNGDYPPAIE